MDGIYSLIDESCVLLDKPMQSIDEIIKTLTNQLSESIPEIATKSMMGKAINEGFHTTCMNNACAITHARCKLMKKSLMAVIRIKPAIDLGAQDKEKVRLVFLLVGPQKSSSYHLKILSRLARILNQSSFRDSLLNATDSEQFLNLIKQKEK